MQNSCDEMKYLKMFENDGEEKPSRLERAKNADLVTLPEGIEGTNCANCKFVDLKNKYCTHKDVDQKVSERMCCALWDAEGTKREWEKEETKPSEE